MSIKLYEFKKAVISPIVIGMTLIFIVFNSFIIFSNASKNDKLKVLNKLVDKFGYEINDKMMFSFQSYYDDQLKEINEITYDRTSKKYKSAREVLEDYSNYVLYNKEQQRFFSETAIMEDYYNIAKNIDESYESINITDLGKSSITTYKLSGQVTETIRSQYKELAERFKELKDSGEYKNLFFIGKVYKMHTFLFGTLFRCFIFEIVILVVLISGYVLNYEFENKTQFLVYSTKRGRKLDRDKFLVSVLLSIVITTIIIGISLAVYFGVFDYSGLWKVSITSGFNWEYGVPYISWWRMSLAKYIICCISLVFVSEVIFTMITYIISCFIRNSYMLYFAFTAIFGLAIVVPSYMPTYNNAIFVPQFTPFVLSTYSMQWFMEKGPLATFKHYELTTITVWAVVLIIMCCICTKRFKKQNIY